MDRGFLMGQHSGAILKGQVATVARGERVDSEAEATIRLKKHSGTPECIT